MRRITDVPVVGADRPGRFETCPYEFGIASESHLFVESDGFGKQQCPPHLIKTVPSQ